MANSGFDKNANGVEKPVKERKEKKKKKDKVVDVSDHAGTQPEITKGTRKKMPVGDPEASVEPELVLSNPGGKEKKKKRERDREDEEPPSGDKKKKKRKKGKTSGATSDSPTAYATDSFLEVAGTSEATGTTVAVKEKKKRKKIKSSAEASDDVDVNVEAEPLSKPKSRKRKKEATAEDEGHTSTTAPVEDSSRKRKRSKKSIHSNPSDDSDLTEQSQKALIYIYSQSTSPDNWKFNKARQNWIIRNIWTSKVPEKYVPMVVEYLSKVQGRVRETLIGSCNKVISGSDPDPPTMQSSTDENGAPEAPNSSASIATKNEKTQRARTLLYALTKKS